MGERAGRVRARVPRVARARRGGVPRSSGSATRPAAPTLGAARSRRASRATSCSRPGSRTAAATTTSSAGSSSRSPTRAATCAASRRASSTTTTRCRRSTSTRRRATLFKKGDLLYGLDTARQPIAKEDRAVVVEGNTDVLALRQAGFEPVVASMGTALTERAAARADRLTKRLFLCFDADAAGQEATLRGMELAVKQGFDVQVVSLPKGTDPGRRPGGVRAAARGAGQLSRAPRAAPARAGARQERRVRRDRRRSSARCRTRPSTRTRAGSRPICSTCRPRRRPALAPRAGARAPPASSRRACSTRVSVSSGARSPASPRIRS